MSQQLNSPGTDAALKTIGFFLFVGLGLGALWGAIAVIKWMWGHS